MTSVSFPFDSALSYETQWMQMARYWRFSGVIPSGGLSSASGSLNDTQTVGSELAVYADSSGLQVKLHYGRAWIQGVYYDLPVGDDGLVLTIAGNGSGNPRIDRVVLRVDWTLNTVTPTVITGTTAVTPAAPALTQTFGSLWDLPLAQVRIASGLVTVASNLVDDERQWPGHTPTGAVLWMAVAAASALRGYLPCDGRAVSRITYADLFALTGTAFGTGDGSTTFNVPDLRDRAAIGLTDMGTYLSVDAGSPGTPRITGITRGASGGTATVTLATANLPSHTHTQQGTITSSIQSADHGHVQIGTFTSGVESVAHAHTQQGVFTSTGVSADHTHTQAGTFTSGLQSVDHTHASGTLAFTGSALAGHAHTAASGGSHTHGGSFFSSIATNAGTASGSTLAASSFNSTSVVADGAHVHSTDSVSAGTPAGTISGSTAGMSASHSHTTTISGQTGFVSSDHSHNVTLFGLTVTENTNHSHNTTISGSTSGMSANHTHTTTLSGETAATGGGTAVSLLQPYLGLSAWIKT